MYVLDRLSFTGRTSPKEIMSLEKLCLKCMPGPFTGEIQPLIKVENWEFIELFVYLCVSRPRERSNRKPPRLVGGLSVGIDQGCSIAYGRRSVNSFNGLSSSIPDEKVSQT